MKTVKFVLSILLVIGILLAVILIWSASYFSWRKKDPDGNERRKYKLRLGCFLFILAATISLFLINLL